MEETGRSVVIHSNDTLVHFGVKGQKWYKRNYQNEDGTLTAEGRIHYGYGQARGVGGAQDPSAAHPVNAQPESPSMSRRVQSRISRIQRQQKWGTNLTGKDPSTMTSQELDAEMARARKEREFYNLQQESRPERFAKAKNIAKQFTDKFINKMIEKGTEKLTQMAVDKASEWLTEKLGANPNNHIDLANVDLTKLSDKQVQAMAQRQENENKINNAKEAFDKKVDAAAKARIEEMKKAEAAAKGEGKSEDGALEGDQQNKSEGSVSENKQEGQKKSKAERKREAREAREKQEREAKEKASEAKTEESKSEEKPKEESKPESSGEKPKSSAPTINFDSLKPGSADKGYERKDEKELAEMRRGLAIVNNLLGHNAVSESDVRRIRELAGSTEEFQRNKSIVERTLNNLDSGELSYKPGEVNAKKVFDGGQLSAFNNQINFESIKNEPSVKASKDFVDEYVRKATGIERRPSIPTSESGSGSSATNRIDFDNVKESSAKITRDLMDEYVRKATGLFRRSSDDSSSGSSSPSYGMNIGEGREGRTLVRRPGGPVPDWHLITRKSGESAEDYASRVDTARRNEREPLIANPPGGKARKRPGGPVPNWSLMTRKSGESEEDYAKRVDRSRKRYRKTHGFD